MHAQQEDSLLSEVCLIPSLPPITCGNWPCWYYSIAKTCEKMDSWHNYSSVSHSTAGLGSLDCWRDYAIIDWLHFKATRGSGHKGLLISYLTSYLCGKYSLEEALVAATVMELSFQEGRLEGSAVIRNVSAANLWEDCFPCLKTSASCCSH